MHDYNYYVLGQYKIDKHTEEIFPERRFLSIVPLWVASRLTMPGIHFSFRRVAYLMYDMTRGFVNISPFSILPVQRCFP